MSRPAPLARATLAQSRMELRLTARRGENLLAMIGIPAAVLLIFGSTSILGEPAAGTRVDTLLPGVLALAIVATGLVNLGIATAYERSYGVLKRLGGSPLGRTGLIGAKILSILVVEFGLVAFLTILATVILGWRPPAAGIDWPLLVVGAGLGTAAFAGAGLALAGSLRPEGTLLVANVLFLLALGLGGILVPVDSLPDAVGTVVRLLPTAALTESLRIALGSAGSDPGSAGSPVLVLGIWAAVADTLAIRTFRWD